MEEKNKKASRRMRGMEKVRRRDKSKMEDEEKESGGKKLRDMTD